MVFTSRAKESTHAKLTTRQKLSGHLPNLRLSHSYDEDGSEADEVIRAEAETHVTDVQGHG